MVRTVFTILSVAVPMFGCEFSEPQRLRLAGSRHCVEKGGGDDCNVGERSRIDAIGRVLAVVVRLNTGTAVSPRCRDADAGLAEEAVRTRRERLPMPGP